MKTKKKGLHFKKCKNFFDFFAGTTKKKRFFIAKSAKKQFLLTNSGVTTIILRVSGLELHSSGTEPVTFFGAQSSLGGHNSCLGGTVPECLPRRAGHGEVLFLVFANRRKKIIGYTEMR